MEKEIQQAAQDYPAHVLCVPFTPYDQLPVLPDNMARSVCSPSEPAPKWQEQFGYVLAESMAFAEKPSLTTRSGSIPDVTGDAASLVAPGNTSELAAAIIGLLTSEVPARPVWANGAAARARAF